MTIDTHVPVLATVVLRRRLSAEAWLAGGLRILDGRAALASFSSTAVRRRLALQDHRYCL